MLHEIVVPSKTFAFILGLDLIIHNYSRSKICRGAENFSENGLVLITSPDKDKKSEKQEKCDNLIF